MSAKDIQEHKFVKGDQRINRKGRPPVLPELKAVIARILSEEKNNTTGLEAIIKAMFLKAVKGDIRAAQELLDRYYGRTPLPVDMTSQGEKLPIINITVKDQEAADALKKIADENY